MEITMYQIDAFSKKPFSGNPAAVCLLDTWLDDEVLQNIAAENNLAETAYIIKSEKGYDLRWFTPEVEIDLCGHATLASAFVVFNYLAPNLTSVTFSTLSGDLTVNMNQHGMLSMDFPARAPTKLENTDIIQHAFNIDPIELWASQDLMVVFESENDIKNLTPNLAKLSKITDYFGIIATAPGDKVDFVSRFFAPNAGIPEDPVTGRAHCVLTPFWADRLNKSVLQAKQLSKRSGDILCENKGNRITMGGYATLFLEGKIYI